LDIENKQNKMMTADEVKNKADTPTSVRAASQLINEYFFPGGGLWKPMTIKAPNREQAEEIHRAKREPVTAAVQAVTPAEPEKAEETETTNE
jgi:hypothetical protein